MKDRREELAALAHEQWSGWMKHLFSKCEETVYFGGELTKSTIPTWARDRWMRQMNTPYAELPEEEKESDRAEADRVIALLGRIG